MSLLLALKRTVRAQRHSANPIVRYAIEAVYAVERRSRVLTHGHHRAIFLLKWFRPHDVHQTSGRTWMDRYPGIFSACRDHFRGRQNLNILSFGCSTGEEVLTLRQYFPHARITGAEINARSLAACRKHTVDERIAFVRSSADTIRRRGPFDAIFCMAVLQRSPHAIESAGVTDLRGVYPFEQFDRQLSELDRLLKRDGLLIVHHAQYLFADATVASRYAPLEAAGCEVDPSLHFDRDGQLLKGPRPCGSIFVKTTD